MGVGWGRGLCPPLQLGQSLTHLSLPSLFVPKAQAAGRQKIFAVSGKGPQLGQTLDARVQRRELPLRSRGPGFLRLIPGSGVGELCSVG